MKKKKKKPTSPSTYHGQQDRGKALPCGPVLRDGQRRLFCDQAEHIGGLRDEERVSRFGFHALIT
jgi:hypothetical protein